MSKKTTKTTLVRNEKNNFSKRVSLRPTKSIKGVKSLRSPLVSTTHKSTVSTK